MVIEVTERCIEHGRRYLARGCPIALAIKDQLGDGCEVGHTYIWRDYARIELPKEVTAFIYAFDNGNKDLKPFSFEITQDFSTNPCKERK